MRFTKRPRTEFEETERKRKAALRWQKKQRERLPLFAAEIAKTQPDIDTVMRERGEQWTRTTQSLRDQKAAQWRKGRRQIDALDPETRKAALHYWNTHKWLPGDPSYLVDMVHGLTVTRRLIVEGGTLRAARSQITAAEASDVAPSYKPPVIPGLTRPKPVTRGPRP